MLAKRKGRGVSPDATSLAGRCVGWMVLVAAPLHLGCLEVPGPIDLDVAVQNEAGPVEGAVVLLMPVRLVDDNQWKLPYAFGRTNREGQTRLKTERGTPGVLPGVYRAWVVETDVDLSLEDAPAPLVRYSTHVVKIVSANVTPRVQLRHVNPRVLEDVDLVPEQWADDEALESLIKALAEAFETLAKNTASQVEIGSRTTPADSATAPHSGQ